MITAHADVVGSLLRPPELLKAQKDLAADIISRAEFKAVEDRAVDWAILLQERSGLEVLTDGEMRRLSFQSQMTDAVDGFGEWDLDAFLWGDWKGDGDVGNWSKERPKNLGVVDKLTFRRHLSVEEFTYLLQSRTECTPKITLPSPSLWVNFWSPEHSVHVYPTLEGFLADIVDILRREVAELIRLGAPYIQIDAPHYPLLLDPKTRPFYERNGWTIEKWLDLGIEMDNAVIGDHPDEIFGIHLCRGNQGSRYLAEGEFGPIAAIFRRIKAQRLLLEYDDERSGSFEPLKEVPEDKTVVLGLITTKSPRRETPEELTERIIDASRFVPLDRLAISPQRGFSTSIVGNRISLEDQRRKLGVLVETARRVWGGTGNGK